MNRASGMSPLLRLSRLSRLYLSGIGLGSLALLLTGARANAQGPQAANNKPVYKACPHDKVWSDAQNGCVCAAGLAWDSSMRVCTAGPVCPAGTVHDKAKPEVCIVTDPAVANPQKTPPANASNASPPACPAGKAWSEALNGCAVLCPPGKVPDAKGAVCIGLPREAPRPAAQPQPPSPPQPKQAPATAEADADAKVCPVGREWRADLDACAPICPPGRVLDDKGVCVVTASSANAKGCPAGREWKAAFDACVPICPADQVLDFKGLACHPIRVRRSNR